jgi:hypothetical protein
VISVLSCKVRVFGNPNTRTFFDVKTLRVNGRMITEVYHCIIFIGQLLFYIGILNCVLHHLDSSRKSYAVSYYVNIHDM